VTSKIEAARALLAEAEVEEAYVVAKAAYRADPSAKHKAAKAAAAAAMTEAHNLTRKDRKGPSASGIAPVMAPEGGEA